MPTLFRRPVRFATLLPTAFALVLGSCWAFREVAFARERAAVVSSKTVTLDQVAMQGVDYEGKPVGKVGFYVEGDTPGSTKFVTGRFILDAGKTNHVPHRHAEEEVLIVETGHGEIFCDGKTTKVGPGSVMYSTPQAPHGILNTGDTPLVFYFIKWVGKPTE